MDTVLLVEDNPHIMTINTELLKDHGYHVYGATSIEMAKSIIDNIEPNIIVLDILLPDGSGLELCKELRENTDIPILLLRDRKSVV